MSKLEDKPEAQYHSFNFPNAIDVTPITIFTQDDELDIRIRITIGPEGKIKNVETHVDPEGKSKSGIGFRYDDPSKIGPYCIPGWEQRA